MATRVRSAPDDDGFWVKLRERAAALTQQPHQHTTSAQLGVRVLYTHVRTHMRVHDGGELRGAYVSCMCTFTVQTTKLLCARCSHDPPSHPSVAMGDARRVLVVHNQRERERLMVDRWNGKKNILKQLLILCRLR